MSGATRSHVAAESFLRLQLAPNSPAAFAFAALCVAVATLVRLGLDLVEPGLVPFPTYFPAVLIAALTGGIAAGTFAAILGAICATWFILPLDSSITTATTNLVFYLAMAMLIVWCAEQFRGLCEQLKNEGLQRNRHLALISDQNDILSQIAAGVPLREVFTKLLRSIESYSNFEMLGSILLMDRDGVHLRHGAAPSLPDSYNRAIDGTGIGPAVGSCGTAAYLKEPVIAADIATDPRWAGWRGVALEHGLRACWSIPIMSQSSNVLGTFAIYYRNPRHPTRDELELISFMSRTALIAIEHDRQDAQRKLLADEMSHRVKNTLTTVQSLASQTLRRKIDTQAWDEFEARLIKLSRTHDLLVRARWESVELHDLVAQTVLEPFVADHGRIRVEGPAVQLQPQLTLLISMALHELCTNAAKYGALSDGAGTVSISWAVTHDDDETERLNLRWAESGGPTVRPPKQKGFGSRLIENALGAELGGGATLDYRADGLVCSIRARLTGQRPPCITTGHGKGDSANVAPDVRAIPPTIRSGADLAGHVVNP
jgi:two-component sensor histidine kinase